MLSKNEESNPYNVSRKPVFSKNGMVATSQPLASQAGLEILKKGGNAVDAAIATAASLTVVEPTSNGIGGDAFAIVWMKNKIYGLNASGKSPESISVDAVKNAGYNEMPNYGWYPVTVPGAPGSWATLSEKFGNLSLSEVLEPAIKYAEEGFPVSPMLAKLWKKAYLSLKKELENNEFSEWFKVFSPDGRAPLAGEIWSSLDHANTLRSIAETNAASFYTGDIAKKIIDSSEQAGGFLSYSDLASYKSSWVDPISVNYRGYDVWEIPPNSQGIVALQALNILKGFDFKEKDNIATYHKQIEAIKLAFADALEYVTEENEMTLNIEDMLSEKYGNIRRKLIGEEALQPEAGDPENSGTVYAATADKDGNMVSFIQSNYRGFGSGIVVPETGIALQNRGKNFSLDSNHVNVLKGKKQTYHTIIPGFLTKENKAIGPFGVMGGFMQPQGHVQVIMNTIDFGLNPQTALDAPRWKWIRDKLIEVEDRFPHHLALELSEKGHNISIQLYPNSFGKGQIIWRDPITGVLTGGTDSRTDGTVACW